MDVCGVPQDEQRPEDLATRALLSGEAPWSAGRGEGGQHPKCLLFALFLGRERTPFCNSAPPSFGTCLLSNFDFQLN